MKDIEQSLKRARNHEPMVCPECEEELFAPMDKLCVALYGKCQLHLEDDSIEEKNLLKICEAL